LVRLQTPPLQELPIRREQEGIAGQHRQQRGGLEPEP
jgi:hypothetical protein